MVSKVKNLIEYSGISDFFPLSPTAFKHFNLEQNLYLPYNKPDIWQIAKVKDEISIKGTKLIKTPKATSLEGQKLTGWKLIIQGEVKQKIEYMSDGEEQSIQVVNFNEPFNASIALPENFKNTTAITITSYIEDSFIHQLNKRCMFKNITMLIDAEFC